MEEIRSEEAESMAAAWRRFISDGTSASFRLLIASDPTEADAAAWLASHDADVLRKAATELDESISHLDPANPVELSYINCTRVDARLIRDRANRIEGERL